MATKTTDRKGRLTLSEWFANRPVIVEEVDDTEVRVTLARIVTERELWLHENRAASAAVMHGLADAKAGRITSGLNLAADAGPRARLTAGGETEAPRPSDPRVLLAPACLRLRRESL